MSVYPPDHRNCHFNLLYQWVVVDNQTSRIHNQLEIRHLTLSKIRKILRVGYPLLDPLVPHLNLNHNNNNHFNNSSFNVPLLSLTYLEFLVKNIAKKNNHDSVTIIRIILTLHLISGSLTVIIYAKLQIKPVMQK